ncbi:phosphoribosylaminoimidazolesuccinocarboxamide synthase [Sphingobacterium sp. HJSM2_6]|uniref:phosphoribosylaminoimidazolesuccinocarboxamide synthase n=1 Tax=Sphingobacterium sp. HJSM2_6 TaxID=3366264 RepID=UPI003BE46C6A
MNIPIKDFVKTAQSEAFIAQLQDFGFSIDLSEQQNDAWQFEITETLCQHYPTERSLIEHFFNELPLEFDALPDLIEGESKVIKLITAKLVMEKFKPTVYSYTHNRYGIAEGTDNLRLKFTSELYRQLEHYQDSINHKPVSSFVAEIKNEQGHFMVQRKVESCNIEIRIKRYHIGSPLHRYKYTEEYETVLGDHAPLEKWSRFEFPIVCFDWRNPLKDHEGNRLADEPISDDYAMVWMKNVPYAKEMARNLFLWIEKLFKAKGIILIDMCIFVDKSGKLIYGEVSPDCMRIRWDSQDLEHAKPLCKDNWRNGNSSDDLKEQYQNLYHIVFDTHE